MFGALGQCVRDLFRDRTKAGLATSTRGRKGGPEPVVNEERLQRARDYVTSGLNVWEAAAGLKIGKVGLYPALQAGAADSWHSVPLTSENDSIGTGKTGF
jgi:hypothetical protein